MKINLTLITLLLAGLPLAIYGQATTPLWTQDDYRNLNYPAEEWYTGFVRDKLNDEDDTGKALKALERDAQNQLAESIIVKIEGSTKVEHTSQSFRNGNSREELITSDYQQAVNTATTATTVKSEVKSYCDPSSGMLYAFAAVRRADLVAFYQQQINLDLNKVETALGIVEQLVAAGKKINAARACNEAKKFFENITLYQDLLAAVNADAGENALQIERNKELQQSVNQLLINLEQSTFVYVDCQYEYKGYKDDAFSSDPEIICDIVKQALHENECSVVDADTDAEIETETEADYTLRLTAYTTQRSDGTGTYGLISYYANVKGSLYNNRTKKKIVDFLILNDPDVYATGKTPEIAATKAFKLPALKEKILEKILPKIKN
ncbi:MAG: hypothetical protein LBD76_08175 [Prevotellaceae bacterium]|jgi:hypothetical protein|nr:hypothetical protein [Prevotellaceae bacterium]